MNVRSRLVVLSTVILVVAFGCKEKQTPEKPSQKVSTDSTKTLGKRAGDSVLAELTAQGRDVFRFETFGNETFWTDTMHMHEVIEKSVDPMTALKVGLKLDIDALPVGILESVDLNAPATTVALLKMHAIVGLRAEVNADNHITRVGITCGLCHSTVDNSVMPGVGKRLDGWPNRDLNVGAIIALSPAITPEQRAVYNSWGPGMYDPRYNIDGKSTPLTLPPAYGLAEIENETYTAEGPISYWNAYVAVTQMHGHGNFSDGRLGIDVKHSPDLVTPKLPALRAYQHSLLTPVAAAGSYDAAGAERGRVVFNQSCASCHVGARGTDNNDGKLHLPEETEMDGAYAARTANKAYRTTPLRGLAHHPPYFHDGHAQTLSEVVVHYNRVLKLEFTADQQRDLVEYLKTL